MADESGDYAVYDTASRPKPVDRIWCDGDIMDVPITADMVPGAELLPRSFIADFADLCPADTAAAAVLGLEENSWADRFQKQRWSSASITKWEQLSEEQTTAAESLGFNHYSWPPRETAADHTVAELKRYLQCRDEGAADGHGGEARAAELIERVTAFEELEAAVLAAQGESALKIIDPDGASYLELIRASARHRQKVQGKRYARDLKMPGGGWSDKLVEIVECACFVPASMATEPWGEDEMNGEIDSREVTVAFQAIANRCTQSGLRWLPDDDKEWFSMDVPARMRAQSYTTAVCFECKRPDEDSEQSVSDAIQPIQWMCECDAGKDECHHIRALVMYVAGMPRSAASGVPPPPTYIANAWKRPAFGACYDVQTPFGELPFHNSNMKRAKALDEEGRELRRSSVRYQKVCYYHGSCCE